MTNQIQFVNMKTHELLEAQVNEKLKKLESKFEWIISARIIFKIEKSTDSQKDKVFEIDLSVPGPNIFSKTYGENFESAIAEGFNDVEKLLKKHKDKMYKSIR